MLRYFFVIFLLLPPTSGASEIRIGVADQHQAALGIDNGRFTGSLARLFQCPLDRLGLEFELITMPHARVLLQLKRGDIDVAMPLVRVGHRDSYAAFARSLMSVEFGLFSKTPVELSGDISDLSFVALRSTASVDLVKMRGGSATDVNSWLQALELARLGRYDGAVIPLAALVNLPAESFAGLNQTTFGSLPISFYISRAIDNSSDLLQRFNAAIKACQP